MKATEHELDYQEATNTYLVHGFCPVTKKAWTLEVDADAYDAWEDRKVLVQDAFPTLTRDQREMLMTGMTQEGWDQMFGPGEDEED